MLPVLRSDPSRILVALLCALVLSRLPAPVFAEDAFSSLVNIHEATAIAEMAAPAAGVPTCDPAIALLIHVPAPADAVNDSINEHAILRL